MGESITNENIIKYFIDSFKEGGHYSEPLHGGVQLDTEAYDETVYKMDADISRAQQLYQELKDKYSQFPRPTLDVQRMTSPIIMYIKTHPDDVNYNVTHVVGVVAHEIREALKRTKSEGLLDEEYLQEAANICYRAHL